MVHCPGDNLVDLVLGLTRIQPGAAQHPTQVPLGQQPSYDKSRKSTGFPKERVMPVPFTGLADAHRGIG